MESAKNNSPKLETIIDKDLNIFPSSIKYIVGNEAAERFGYYGMRAVLMIFMTKYILDSYGNPKLS